MPSTMVNHQIRRKFQEKNPFIQLCTFISSISEEFPRSRNPKKHLFYGIPEHITMYQLLRTLSQMFELQLQAKGQSWHKRRKRLPKPTWQTRPCFLQPEHIQRSRKARPCKLTPDTCSFCIPKSYKKEKIKQAQQC